jgi:hypothetical protein
MMRRATKSLALLGLCLAASSASPFSSPRKEVLSVLRKSSQQHVISVRGGAGPLNPTLVAKVVTVLFLVHGAYMALAPGPSLDSYGFKTSSATATKCMRYNGLLILTCGVYGYSLIFQSYDINTAFALGALLWVAEGLHSLWNGQSLTTGPSVRGEMASLAVVGATAISGLNKLPWAGSAFKFNAIFVIMSGLLLLDPNLGSKVWGIKNANGTVEKALITSTGTTLLIAGLMQASLAWDGDIVKAIRKAALGALIINIYSSYFTKHLKDNEMDLNNNHIGHLFWLAGVSVVAVTILL